MEFICTVHICSIACRLVVCCSILDQNSRKCQTLRRTSYPKTSYFRRTFPGIPGNFPPISGISRKKQRIFSLFPGFPEKNRDFCREFPGFPEKIGNFSANFRNFRKKWRFFCLISGISEKKQRIFFSISGISEKKQRIFFSISGIP